MTPYPLVPAPAAGALDATPSQRLLRAFLAGRSPATLRAYGRDLADFAAFCGLPSADDAAARLLAAGQGGANELALAYRNHLFGRELAPATVNRRLAALRSLVKLARTLGLVIWGLEVAGLRSEPYRDTRGPGAPAYRRLLARLAGDGRPKALRDTAILRLLFDLGLRRVEVCRLDLADHDADGPAVMVLGKGRHEKARLALPPATAAAVAAWRAARPDADTTALFVRLDRAGKGGRLDGRSVYRVVRALGEAEGVRARPHGLRHSAITAALDAFNGDVRKVARFSRHKNLNTLTRYDDNRRDDAGEVSRRLSEG